MCVVDGIENGACSSSAGTHTSYATAGFAFASTLATKTFIVGGEIKTLKKRTCHTSLDIN